MTRYGKIFLLLLAIGVLAWILPWLYSFATPDTRYAPFTLMSEVNDQLLHNLPADEKGLSMIDQQGRVYSGEAIDSMLPTFYYRQLIADGRLPDTLRGVAMTPKAIQAGNFIFRSSPSDLNRRVPGLYPLLESRSGRVDLEMPDDVFPYYGPGDRIHRHGHQYHKGGKKPDIHPGDGKERVRLSGDGHRRKPHYPQGLRQRLPAHRPQPPGIPPDDGPGTSFRARYRDRSADRDGAGGS